MKTQRPPFYKNLFIYEAPYLFCAILSFSKNPLFDCIYYV